MAQLVRSQWVRFVAVSAMGLVGLVGASVARPAQAASERVGMIEGDRGAQQPPQPSPSGAATASARAIYNRACGRCHPNGEEDIGPRLRDRNDPEDEVRVTIRRGHGRMRAISTTRLSDADLDTLIPYLRTQLHAVR